jgi:phospholipase/carboxylesterase
MLARSMPTRSSPAWLRVCAAAAVCLAVATCRPNASPAADWGGLEVQVVTGMAEKEPGGTAVVLLHGWGADGDDLVPLAHELRGPRIRVIVPAAPLPHPHGGRMWWALDLDRRRQAIARGQERQLATEVPPGLAPARAKVQALLRQVRERFRPQVLVLAGFSQGGMLATDVALAADPPVDKLASLSGTFIAEPVWRERMKQIRRKPAMLLSHGREDALLPFAASERLRQVLVDAGFDVAWVPFAGGHAIPREVIARLRTFLQPAK